MFCSGRWAPTTGMVQCWKKLNMEKLFHQNPPIRTSFQMIWRTTELIWVMTCQIIEPVLHLHLYTYICFSCLMFDALLVCLYASSFKLKYFQLNTMLVLPRGCNFITQCLTNKSLHQIGIKWQMPRLHPFWGKESRSHIMRETEKCRKAGVWHVVKQINIRIQIWFEAYKIPKYSLMLGNVINS